MHLLAKHRIQVFHGGKHFRAILATASQETRQSSCPAVLWRSQSGRSGTS